MARSIWTGAISFGLVTVPVKMYSAVSRKTVRFHQLNKTTGARIQMRRVDPSTGDEVPYEDIVKGFELAPDRYVIIEPEELEALDPKKTKTIDIEDVVEADRIDELEAVREVEVTKRELDIAEQLVESLAGDFQPQKYRDTYREEVLALIERKASGEDIAVQPAAEEAEEPVPDLMAALKASLDAVRERDGGDEGDGAKGGDGAKPKRKASAKRKAPAKKAAAKS